jgi:tetratricopeptide (TPR) repeat protein
MHEPVDALLLEARDLFQAGDLKAATSIYQAVLRVSPRNCEANYRLGLMAAKTGRTDVSAAYLKAALEADPFNETHWLSYAKALLSLGRAASALAVLEQSKRCGISSPRLTNLLNEIRTSEGPKEAQACFERGNVLKAQGRVKEAVTNLQTAIARRPDFAEAHNNLGAIHLEQGRHDLAAAAFGRALTINPKYAEAHNNLGIALYRSGDLDHAAAMYERALALRPEYAEALSNLGVVWAALGRQEEAIACLQRAIVVRPDLAETYHHLGAVLCERRRVAEGYSYYLRVAELTYLSSVSATQSAHKARHDREQREYLRTASSAHLETGFHIEGGEILVGRAINPQNDIPGIQNRWRYGRPQLVVIDDFLTPEALEGLRRFCWGSTIWRESFDSGYVGTRPESGFACPLLAQLAEELRLTYSGIFADHPLIYSWAFNYDSRLLGTKIHADFALVNVNFWTTPDEANIDSQSGGLVVWDAAAPADWTFEKYNVGEKAIRSYLASKNAKPITIPYRCNRAVIFNSNLFHETDRMNFMDGYTERRINITFLYGWRSQ